MAIVTVSLVCYGLSNGYSYSPSLVAIVMYSLLAIVTVPLSSAYSYSLSSEYSYGLSLVAVVTFPL